MQFGRREREDMTKEFNISTIQDYLRYADSYLFEILEYIDIAYAQLAIAAQTEFKTYVNLTRQHFKHVNYYVSASKVPITGVVGARTVYLGYNKVFKGNERKAAFEYAEQLAKELNAEIIKSF